MYRKSMKIRVLVVVMSLILTFTSGILCVATEDASNVSGSSLQGIYDSTGNGATDKMTTTTADMESTEYSNKLNKLHFYIGDEDYAFIDDTAELTAAMSATKQTQVEGILATDDEVPTYQVTVQFASAITATDEYQAFMEERETLDSVAESRDFRTRFLAYARTYYQTIMRANRSLLEGYGAESVQAFEYLPIVKMTMTAEDLDADALLALADSDRTAHISVSPMDAVTNDTTEDGVSSSLATRTASTRESVINYRMEFAEVVEGLHAESHTENYTGNGIRVGIYGNAQVNPTNTNLDPDNVELWDFVLPISDDVTNVARLVYMLAPDVEIYSACDSNSSFGMALDWLVDSGCDVILYTYDENPDPNTADYSYQFDADGILDFISRVYLITVVTPTGDDTANDVIVSPGYASNAITVGGVRRRIRNTVCETLHDEISAYKYTASQESTVIKPDVVAFSHIEIPDSYSDNDSTPEYLHGTRYAAAQVAGCIALLMEQNAQYMGAPDRVRATLAATADKVYGYEAPFADSGYHQDDKVGVGLINLQRITTNTSIYTKEVSGEINNVVDSFNYFFFEGMEFQLALTWDMYLSGTPITPNIQDIQWSNYTLEWTDLDVEIYDPSGNVVACSYVYIYDDTQRTTMEFIRFNVETAGVHRIEIFVADGSCTSRRIYCSYNVKYS